MQARGEELRRKQNDIDIPRGSSEDDDSDSDSDDGGEGPRGLLSRLRSEEEPQASSARAMAINQ